MARYEFTMASDAMLQGLEEAGATGSETRAYLMLVRGLPKDRSKAECWMPADMAEVKVGMRPDVFSRALRGLCEKTVHTSDGELVPILTKVSRGCRGHCPHYEDTLGLAIANGDYPPTIARQNRNAIDEPNARQKQAPLDEFSTSEWKAKTGQLEGKKDPIGRQTCNPINTRQDKHTVADALLPSAERSVGVSQPDKQNPKTLRVDTGTESPRAEAGAGQGRPAPALPSWAELMGGAPAPEEPVPDRAEYDRVERMLQDGRFDELTEQDRKIYHAGHKAYAPGGYQAE